MSSFPTICLITFQSAPELEAHCPSFMILPLSSLVLEYQALTDTGTHRHGHSQAWALTDRDAHRQGHSQTCTFTDMGTQREGHSQTQELTKMSTHRHEHSQTQALTDMGTHKHDTHKHGHSQAFVLGAGDPTQDLMLA